MNGILVILSPTLLTEKTDDRLDDDHLVQVTAEAAKALPDCHRIVICLRYGIKGGCARRTTSAGESAWSTYAQCCP